MTFNPFSDCDENSRKEFCKGKVGSFSSPKERCELFSGGLALCCGHSKGVLGCS